MRILCQWLSGGNMASFGLCSLLKSHFAQTSFGTCCQSYFKNLVLARQVFDELDLDADGRVGCRDFITMMRMRGLG